MDSNENPKNIHIETGEQCWDELQTEARHDYAQLICISLDKNHYQGLPWQCSD